MNRLQSELHRLYPQHDTPDHVHAMVMELTQPPNWELLSTVWHGVQAELELPAPAIAVSGTDGLQLWFSLAEPVEAAQAQAFLENLRSRFLPDVDARRLRLTPASALPTPPHREPTGNWSAFVAPDLAPVFAETPWLDLPPNEDGQAALLSGLHAMKRPVFEAALKRLAPRARPMASTAASTEASSQMSRETANEDPRGFLRRVMNDETVPLALRIDAAKALLQHGD